MSTPDPSSVTYGQDSPLVTRGQIEHNMLDHMVNWLLPYLARVERLNGLTAKTIPPPKSWEVINEFTRYPEEMLPYVAVISPGTTPGVPAIRDGDGWVRMRWSIAVGAIVSARDERNAKDLAGYYGAAIRGAVMEMPDLGGWADGVDLSEEKYDDFPRITERTMAAVRLVFTVEVQEVINVYGAPRQWDGSIQVPDDPYSIPSAFPEVIDVEADVSLDDQ